MKRDRVSELPFWIFLAALCAIAVVMYLVYAAR